MAGTLRRRIIASVCLLATVATRYAISPLHERYASLETGLMAIDALVLVAFVWIALRSERFWPLWIAGLQLTNSVSHAMKLAEFDLVPRAYAAAAAFWSYPILFLAVGTWRGHQRGRQEAGRSRLP